MAGINDPIQNMRNLDRGNVYGTFPGGNISYDPSMFERERADGTTIIDLVPDARVFVFGAEITKDVKDVSIKHGLKGSTCNISLANPRGKYEINKSDLVGNWREDKDILATYEYDRFDRQKKMSPDVLKMLTSRSQYNKIRGYQETFFRGAGSHTPTPSNVTRMAFETKFFSGIDKQVGDMVFDFRDPVMVFLKGRFSPYWYFAFTGVLVKWDDNDTYGQEQTISLFAEDLFYLWKRQKFTKQGSILRAGNLESATRNINSKQAFNIYKNVLGQEGTTLDKAIKILAYGGDYAGKVQNCYPLYTDRYKTYLEEADLSKKKGVVSAIRGFLNKEHGMGGSENSFFLDNESFMLTWGDNPEHTGTFSAEPKKSHLINLSQLKSNIQGGKLNSLPFSEWLTLYPQLNAITINDYEDAKELQYKYMASVRFWEVRPKISVNNNDKTKTGWSDDGSFIGACGTHPALTNEFVDKFDMLGNVWADCHTHYTKDSLGNNVLDKLNVSPHEKIREIISGSPTENRNDLNNEMGKNVNLFRPRLFVIMPQKFQEENRGIMATALGQLSLHKETATNTHKALIEVLDAIEFTTYCSAMGDIFIEPEMYDFHPQDFLVGQDRNVDGKIEERSPILKKASIRFRAIMDDIDPETKKVRIDRAFMYNTKANHPFFLNEKDRIRCTQSFKPENIKTHIEVIPSMFNNGGVIQELLTSFLEKNMTVFQADKYDGSKTGSLSIARYIADGFSYRISRDNLLIGHETTAQVVKDLNDEYQNLLMSELFESYKNMKFEEFLIEASSAMEQLVTYEDYKINGWGVDNGTVDEIKRLNSISLVYLEETGELLSNVDNDYGFTQLEFVGIRIMEHTAPIILQLLAMTNSKSKNTELQQLRKAAKFGKIKNSIGLKPTSIIGNWFGLKDFSNSYTAFAKIGVPERANAAAPPAVTIAKEAIEQVQKELLKLYEAIALNGASSDAKELYERIYNLKNSKTEKFPPMLNLSDLKKLEDKGIYNPRTDMVRRYGYNPGPIIKNMMVNSGGEAQRYAVTKFNQLYGKAHTIHMDIIGRPELFLNRPYYCERKDAIGLLENFTLNFSIGSDFQTSLDLTYIRKNSLTYGYTMGNLDTLVGGGKGSINKNNEYFKKAAEAYYESISSMNQKLSNALQNKYSEVGGHAFVAAGSGIGLGSSGQKLSGLLGEKAFSLSGAGFAGALYSAHDWIGHLEYNKRGTTDNVTNAAVSGMITSPQLKLLVSSVDDAQTFIMGVRITCMDIRRELEELTDIEITIDKEKEELGIAQMSLLKVEADIYNAITKKSGSTKIRLFHEDEKVLLSQINIIKSNENQYKLLHAHKMKIIYGINGGYTVGVSTDPTKPTGTRTPDITLLDDATEYMKTAKNTALYYKLVNEIMSFNVELANIKLKDDRIIGTFKQGFDTSFVHKIGDTSRVPFYAFIASGGGSSSAAPQSASST